MPRPGYRHAALLVLALVVSPTVSSAQVVQSLQVGIGAFLPRGLDSRAEGDVMVENLLGADPLAFGVEDFRRPNVFGGWLVAFGDHVEVGGEVGYYAATVPSAYVGFEHDASGRDVAQDLSLRIAPAMAVIRFLPFGGPGDMQPYLGAGAGLLAWRYAEVGEFVDTSDPNEPFPPIFAARFTASGVSPGGLLLGGVRVPLGGDIFGFTAEYRYQFGQGDTGGSANGFLGDTIDLSGGNLRFGFLVRF